ncbi:tetraspanin-18 [Biomphalaria pfeifferi]|uniref:Tetraspanin-18 n=1 Tax=Biomphalaria pfeifferi TaxID=112525 RepID=A0AAD8CAN4_BIOPF|nr:tetraspanin-18 [Biomphalaria pfeifferi]
MAISLIWGIVILAMGTVIKFNFGKLVSGQLEELDTLDLSSCKSATGQSICPVTKKVPEDIDLGDWVHLIGTFVILSGVLVTVFSAIGFVAALKHSTPLIVLFIVVCLGATSIQFYLVQVATSEENGFHNSAKTQLKHKLNNEYTIEGTKSTFTLVFNAIQMTLGCCGINGVRDFNNLSFVEKFSDSKQTISTKSFAVPPSCCRKNRYFCTSCTDANYIALTRCAQIGASGTGTSAVSSKGCYRVMFEQVSANSGHTIMGILLFIIVWEMLQIVLGILVKFTPPVVEEPPPPPPPPPEPVISLPKIVEPEIEEEKFVAHARPSTFDHPDVNRIKSTEIW